MFNFQDLVSIIINQQPELIIIFFIFSYILLPFLGIPMMVITYFLGLVLGFKWGLFISLAGYIINMILIYELAGKLKKLKYLKKKIIIIKEKFAFVKNNFSLPIITIMAMLLPYLPLLVFLGLTQSRKIFTYFAIFIGSLPALLISLQAGHLGNQIFFGASKERIALSGIVLFLTLSLHYILIRRFSKKGHQNKYE